MTYFTTGAQLQAAINDLPASKKGSFTAFDGFYYGEKYMAAYSGSLTPLEHFAQIGADRGYAPSATFDPAFYANSYADLKGKGLNSADLLYHFLQFGLDEGRVPNATLANFNATQYLANNADVAQAIADAIAANPTAFGGSTSNGALAHFVKFGQFESRSDESVTAGSSMRLTTGQDVLNGSANNDTFNANFADNSNTFQSGDVIDGGAGSADVLNIDLGTSSNFAILASTTGVENVFIRAQSTNANGSSGNNNVDTTGQKVTVDAEKMVGVTQWWSNESRADLKIEDVRILDGQITKEITIGMRNTDAGSMGANTTNNKVDFEVYFSPESLRDRTTNIAANTLVLEIMDVKGAQLIAQPLLNLPLEGFTARLSDDSVLVIGAKGSPESLAINKAASYGELVTALNAAVAANPLAAGKLTFSVGNAFVATSSATGESYTATGNQLIATLNNAATPTVGFKTSIGPYSDVVSVSSFEFESNQTFSEFRINKQFVGGASNTTELITSTIILDNVGREDEAGSLTIGSMSTHGGVERFEITVENNADNAYAGTQSGSWLSNMQSTNNNLREVQVKNAAEGIANPDYLYLGTNMDRAGNNLGNQQDWPGGMDRDYDAITAVTTSLLNTDGLTDVRVFDASAMTGNVFVGAAITGETIRKYQNLVDTVAHSADDVAFEYKTGAGNDSINLEIDGSVTASSSNAVVGRHDFSFLVDGGAGNDNIQVRLVDGDLSGNTENWYNNQAINDNVTVNGGAGNDTIRTPGAGDVVINAGADNDTVYTDNTGVQVDPAAPAAPFNNGRAVFVFNAVDGDAVAAGNQYAVTDLKSQQAVPVMAVNANLTVTYKGLTSTKTIGGSNDKLSNVAITDLTINQAIKAAINTDDVLNKLLVAVDGPGRTLAVLSLTDGAHVLGDLGITFGATPLSVSQVAAGSAVTLFSPVSNELTDGYLTTNFGQYQTGADIVGAASIASSDNTINLGTGNDVLVLGTGANSNETVKFDAGFSAVDGKDTIVNFAAAGTGMDHLDFTGINGTTLTTAYTTDKGINIQLATTLGISAIITVEQAIASLYNANNLVAAQNHVFVSVDSTNNVGTVYSVTDAIGATNAVATLAGKIDLANTNWFDLTAANFLPAVAVVPPTGVVSSVTADLANVAEGSNVTFTANVSGYLAGATITPTFAGTATEGTDYAAGVFTVNADLTTATMVLTATDDGLAEDAESIDVTVGGQTASTSIDASVAAASTVNVTAADSVDAAAANYTYAIAMGTYQYDIANFAAGDVLDFVDGNTASLGNMDFADGNVDLTFGLTGQLVTIHLTGLSTANDAALGSANDFNTVFGPGSLI